MISDPLDIAEIHIAETDGGKRQKTELISRNVQNGISDVIDPSLLSILSQIAEGKMAFFYVQSFKMLTRNFGKLMRIMEFVLTHDAPFVTNNYYIENGYIEKRAKPIRAPLAATHSMYNMISYPGAGKKHNAALDRLMKNGIL